MRRAASEGWHGWDDYAAFYDWENARTMQRRDVLFWRDVARRHGGLALELGSGTGRVTIPMARAGVRVVGVDRSGPMLALARRRIRRAHLEQPPTLVRADIRALPFSPRTFDLVVAPYGVLQSLLRDRDLTATLDAIARVLKRGGRLGLELVPDVPHWQEHSRRCTISGQRGRTGIPIKLFESVRQDRRRRLTVFDHEYIEGRGPTRRVHRFTVTFRTLSIAVMRRRLERAGLVVDAVLGGYDGRPWDDRAEAWVLLATNRR